MILNLLLNNFFKKKIKYIESFLGFPYQLFRHKRLIKIINFKYAVSTNQTTISNNFLKKLILNFKQRMLNYDFKKNNDSWDNILLNHHLKLVDIFLNDKQKSLEILNNPQSTDLFFGFDSNCISLKKKPRHIDKYENNILTIDKLLSFAEFLGIKRIDNPERYRLINRKKINLEELINKIEKKIKIKLEFKNPFPGEQGILTKKGILTNREVQAIYQAYRIKQYSKLLANNPSIAEIGGGLGRTAYYCWKFNIKDYTLIDIPISSLCQANYLARVIGEKNILLKLDPKFLKCKIISPSTFFSSKKKYDLIFNSDSLTEIHISEQKKYIKSILSNTKIFYSINHENNLITINCYFKDNYKSYDRNLYWLRRGYIEEVFKF